MAESVTIEKAHFEALLRRAEFHSNDAYDPSSTYAPPGYVLIPEEEYDALRKSSREFEILRRALYRGGLPTNTLESLIANDPEDDTDDTVEESLQGTGWGDLFQRPAGVPVTITNPHATQLTPDPSEQYAAAPGHLPAPRAPYNRSASFATESYNIIQDDEFEEANEPKGYKPPFPRHDKRSLFFANLPEGTTHKDIVDVVRGGRVLDIYLRKDRSATVSFVEGAQEFLTYARKRDIYIRQKRIEVRWADRQFQLPGHIANKISTGATRNLLIRGGASKLTEEQIKDDMEHIHNLIIVDVSMKSGDVYVSTNSIHNALFARTCMMSRQPYKGLRIEWYTDECAGPLPKPQAPAFNAVQPKKSAPKSAANFYAALLDVDGTDEATEDDDNDTLPSAGLRIGKGLGIGIEWSDTAIAT